MTIRAIQWGTGFENILVLGELYSPVTDREYRDGSVFEQGPSGIETSWVTGKDYVLEADIRWIPDTPGGAQTPVSGSVAFQAFLDWARDTNPFRFVPDSTLPLFYVDNCYLVEPRRGGGRFENIKRSTRLKIRNATMDFHLALRGLMLEYSPGADISPMGLNGTFGRGLEATRIGVDGLLATQPAAQLRDRHYTNGLKTALLERDVINVVLWCRDLTNAAWTKVNVTPVKDQVGIDGVDNSASRITASAGNGTCLQAITLASSARCQSAYVKRLVGSGTIQMTTDNGGTWTTVTVTVAYTRVTIPIQTLANPTVGFRIVTNGDSIAVDYVQNEQAYAASVVAPSSPIATTTAAGLRNGDFFILPFLYKPQAMWAYLKFVELGGGWALPQDTTHLFGMGYGSGPGPFYRFMIINGGAPGEWEADSTNATVFSRSAMTTPAPIGSVIELLATWSAAGLPNLRWSIDGGAEVAGGSFDPPATFGPAWSSNVIGIGGNQAGVNQGAVAMAQVKMGAGTAVNTIALARVA